MNRTTNKAKLEQFDALKEDRDTMQLAFFDYVNKRFCPELSLDCQGYTKEAIKGSKLKIQASWRAMPIFLIHWFTPGEKTWTPYFMTETQLDELSRADCTDYQRMLRDAFWDLKQKRAAR